MGKVEGLLILLAIIMLFFGAKKLPELARGVGDSVRELKKGFNGDDDSVASTSKPAVESSEKK